MADLQDWQQMIDLCKALTLQEIFISNTPWIEPLKTLVGPCEQPIIGNGTTKVLIG
jgi:hypothetical protein